MAFLARDDQYLRKHGENTAVLAESFAQAFECGSLAHCAGILHDLGKFTKAFQDYLTRKLKGENATRGEVIHAFQGAKLALETIPDPVVADVISSVIAAHHGGLFDIITNGERTLLQKINKNKRELNYEEAVKAFKAEMNLDIDLKKMTAEISNICEKSRLKKLNPCFMLHLITKTLYSCLVDADRCDAAGIIPGNAIPDWDSLIQLLEKHLDGFTASTDLDVIRNRISEQCKEAGRFPQGVYTLSVPTGGGKTLSSLRFALMHAKAYGLKRIIYVIPYLSILDQTAKIFQKIVGAEKQDLILEHHSDLESAGSDEENERQKLLASRWESPIILTTMVQFLETIYSNRASKLRKFHNMSEAVLIFDEIQSLPIKCIHLFNDAANFLSHFGKSTILLCTATQPQLNKVNRPVLLSDNPALVNLLPDELKTFERVTIEDRGQEPMSHLQIAELAQAQLEKGKSTLVILNTKGDARKVFEHCKTLELGQERALLTTDLCPAHRLVVLERLHDALNSSMPTLCVSTQLIEAGVNISFGCVIRAKAGLDSIVQAAGRCNRNNEQPDEPQKVFVVDVKDENLTRLPEIAESKRQTSRVINELEVIDLLSGKALDLFYKYYFFDQQNKMDYDVKHKNSAIKTTVYSLLSNNPLALQAYNDYTGKEFNSLPAAFQTASEAFSIIDGGQTGIVVPYGNALKLVCEFQKAFDPLEKMRVLRHLQKYTVNVYCYTLRSLANAGALKNIDDAFYLLSPDWYDANEQGLLSEACLQLLDV